MSDQNFVIIGTTAVYNGVIDAFHINEAAKKAQRLAVTGDIEGLEATLPNSEFDEHGAYPELKSKGFKILRSEEGATVVGLRFVRAVSVAVEVEQRSQPVPTEPMDLSHRRVV
jgi:hypothetical protein